jgi:hypothetical protein
VVCGLLHTFGMFWIARQIFGSSGQDNRCKDLDLWIFLSFYQVHKSFLIEILGLVRFASYVDVQSLVDPWLMSVP